MDLNSLMGVIFLAWVFICVASWVMQSLLVIEIKKFNHDKWVFLGEPVDTVGLFVGLFNAKDKFAYYKHSFRWFSRVFRYIFRGDVELDKAKDINLLRKINFGIYSAALLILVLYFISPLII